MSEIETLPGRKVTGTMARRLARHLERAHQLALKHTQAVDAVAAQFGFRNRHELSKSQESVTDNTGSVQLTLQQRTVLLYYAGGEHADRSTRDAALAVSDPLLDAILRMLDGTDDDATAETQLRQAEIALNPLSELVHVSPGTTPDDPAQEVRRRLEDGIARAHAATPATTSLLRTLAATAARISDPAATTTDTLRAIGQRMHAASREIERLHHRLAERGSHALNFGRIGADCSNLLVSAPEDLDRIATCITDAGPGAKPRYTIHLPNARAIEVSVEDSYPYRMGAWRDVPLTTTERRIAAGEMSRITAHDLPEEVFWSCVRPMLQRVQADLFDSRTRWMEEKETCLARMTTSDPETPGTPPRQGDGINARQRLLLNLYDNSAHAGLNAPVSVRATRDGLLIWAFELLADGPSDGDAARRLREQGGRLETLRLRLERADDAEPGVMIGALDGFQAPVLREMPDYTGPSQPDSLNAVTDPFVRMVLSEVAEARGIWDAWEMQTTLETLNAELYQLAAAFQRHGQGLTPDPVAKPAADMPLVRTREELARLLLRVTDNQGATADRYTLQFSDGDGLALSDSPASPIGVSMWTEIDPSALDESVQAGKEHDVKLTDLPEQIVRHAISRANEAYAELARDKMRRGLTRANVLDQLEDLKTWTCGPEYIFDVL